MSDDDVLNYLKINGFQEWFIYVHIEKQDDEHSVVRQLLEFGAILLMALEQGASYYAQDLYM